MPSLVDRLRRALLDRLTGRLPAGHPAGLTVGVEQEFFLTTPAGDPATHAQSQAFFSALAAHPDWSLLRGSGAGGGGLIEEAVARTGLSAGTAIKYDHHPHLLEIASPPCATVHELRDRVAVAWASVTQAASGVGLGAVSSATLPVPADDPRVVSPLPAFVRLRHYRAALYRRRGEPPPAAVNYAAVIAATQTHVGGLGWIDAGGVVNALYGYEPELLGLAARAAVGPGGTAEEVVRTRWSGYLSVFRGYPLVGFPPGDGWSVDSWLGHLLASPLAGGPGDPWAGSTLAEWGEPPGGDWDAFFAAVRDLQIVRPRLFGTVEFRADPAQPDADAVARLAALRLGLAAAVFARVGPPADGYAAARCRWQGAVAGTAQLPPSDLVGVARAGLVARGLGEEGFLGLPQLNRE